MTLRRWLALSLIAVLALTTVGPARAQIPMIANGIIHATVASVNVANTTTEQLLYQYPIPAALIASWTSSNTAFGAAPLHLRLNGTINTNSSVGANNGVGPVTLGVNLGGALATMTLINGWSPAGGLGTGGTVAGGGMGKLTPVTIDVIFSPIATLTTQNCTDLRPCNQSLFMTGRFAYATQDTVNQGAATETVLNAATFGTVNVLTGQTLNVVWRWASAASQNSLNIYNGVLKLGF